MILHADAVAQNRSASVRTSWIYGDDARPCDCLCDRSVQADRPACSSPLLEAPVRPRTRAFPLCGNNAFSRSDQPGARFSTVEMARASARTSPERSWSIQSLVSWCKQVSVKQRETN